jgi:hypothetical protein
VDVLHRLHVQARGLVEAFKKETPRIAKDLGLKDEQVGDVGGGDGVGHGELLEIAERSSVPTRKNSMTVERVSGVLGLGQGIP